MVLKSALRYAATEAIKHMDIDRLYAGSIPREDKVQFRFLNKTGVLDDKLVEDALEDAIFRAARNDFVYLIREGSMQKYADHVGTPQILAYAIEKGIFKPKELQMIPIDHGYTPAGFCARYHNPKLLTELRLKLINTKPSQISKDKSYYDKHP